MSVVDGPATRVPGTQQPSGGPRRSSLFDRAILGRAAVDSVRKLDPRVQVKNPVMFVVLIGTIITLVESIAHSSVSRAISRLSSDAAAPSRASTATTRRLRHTRPRWRSIPR